MQEEKNEVVIFRVPLCKQGEPEMKKKTVSKDPLAEKIEEMFREMIAGKGAVRATIHKYVNQ